LEETLSSYIHKQKKWKSILPFQAKYRNSTILKPCHKDSAKVKQIKVPKMKKTGEKMKADE
jgi:hypothetical protein